MDRSFVDASLKANVALPNAANVANTNVVDLGSTTPFPLTEKFQVKIETSAATAANSKNVNVVLQSSNEASANFANIADFSTLVVAGGASARSASSRGIQLPPNTKRYIRAQATGEANGGDASDGTLTISLLF